VSRAAETPATVEAVSPEFPCGTAWLANCLLELRVPIWRLWGFDTRSEWIEASGGTHRYVATHDPWKQTLAALRPGRTLRFRDGIAARFSHDWPWQLADCARIVLVVRDPRDALHSQWHRHRDNHGLDPAVSFGEFVQRPFFEAPFSSVDMLWLYLYRWLSYCDRHPGEVLVLRFEDWKHEPETVLRGVCDWLGLEVSAGEIRDAAAASEVRRLQNVEEEIRKRDPHARRFNRRGQAEEWRDTWQHDWYATLGPHWAPVMAGFGYPPLLRTNSALQAPDLADLLRWQGVLEPRRDSSSEADRGSVRRA
jgi:hypothetical protein